MSDPGKVPDYNISGFSTDPSTGPSMTPEQLGQMSVVGALIATFTPLIEGEMQQLESLGVGTDQINAIWDDFTNLGTMLVQLGEKGTIPSDAGQMFESAMNATRAAIEALPSNIAGFSQIKTTLLSALNTIGQVVNGCPIADLIDQTMTDAAGVCQVLWAVGNTAHSDFNQDKEASLFTKYFENLQSDMDALNNLVSELGQKFPLQGVPQAIQTFSTAINQFYSLVYNITLYDPHRFIGSTFTLGKAVKGDAHIPVHSFLNDLNFAVGQYNYEHGRPGPPNKHKPGYSQSGLEPAYEYGNQDLQTASQNALQTSLPAQEQLTILHDMLTTTLGQNQQMVQAFGSLTSAYEDSNTAYYQAQETLMQSASTSLAIDVNKVMSMIKMVLGQVEKGAKEQLNTQEQLIQGIRKIR